jgi:hydrogenase-4 component I
MLKILFARIKQKLRTFPYPKKEPVLPKRFRGMPIIHPSGPLQPQEEEICPTRALHITEKNVSIDLGKCIFCKKCENITPPGAIRFSQDYRLAARKREDLLCTEEGFRRAEELESQMKKLLHRSLRLRHISAGGCNGCEADCQVLNTLVFDLGRFGIQFVASPRHADGIMITGPVTNNMKFAVKKTYDAIADPKIVIAVGACAISGGPYIDLPDVCNGADQIIPVDVYIPGCPPHPYTILDGLLRLLGKINATSERSGRCGPC